MAGIKISALPPGATVANDDLIPYVDVSDTSEAATGTTKYMEKSLLDIPTSGTWTPVISGVTNAADVSAVAGFYANVGGVVSGWIKATLELTDEVLTLTSFKFSLPVLPAANFADADKLIGAVGVQKVRITNAVSVVSTATAKTATVNYDGTEAQQLNILSISFSYQV